MGEKGNLLDLGEEIFANLVEQGPQFWIDYEQYKRSRAGGAAAPVVGSQQPTIVRPAQQAKPPSPPGTR